MQNHHRTVAAIASAALFVAFSAHAAKGAVYQAPPAEPEYSRFTLTGGATYLLPSMNGVNYADYANAVTGVITPEQIERNYNWGYFLAAGYMISNQYDVQVSWAQSDATNNSSSIACDFCIIATATGGVITEPGFGVSTQETLNYQAFDGTLGQYHQLGEHLMTRVFAGVRYAKISNNTTNNIFDTLEGGSFDEYYDSTFSGWGPEAGVDISYGVYEWFSIVGHFAGAFLIGEINSNTHVFTASPPVGFATIDNNVKTHVVPALDAKLGLNLSIPFFDDEDRFMVEAGYQVDYYFDAVNQNLAQLTEILFEGSISNYTDVAWMGPYANLSVKF